MVSERVLSMGIINSFITLDKEDKYLIIKTLILGYRIRFMTWIYSFPKLQEKINKMGDKKGPELGVYRIIWAVQATSPYILRSTCLTKAFTALVPLSLNDCSSTLRIGVKKESDFEVHAWLEMDGVVVLGKSEHEFVHLTDL